MLLYGRWMEHVNQTKPFQRLGDFRCKLSLQIKCHVIKNAGGTRKLKCLHLLSPLGYNYGGGRGEEKTF